MYVEEKNKHLPEKNPKSLLPCSGDLLLHYVVVKRVVGTEQHFTVVLSKLRSKDNFLIKILVPRFFFWTDFHYRYFLFVLKYCQVEERWKV